MLRSCHRKLVPAILALGALLALIPAAASAADPPDPLDRGPYATQKLNPFRAGLATLQEPNGTGGPPGTGGNSSITLQVRGSAFVPVGKPGKSPVIVLVHGNHSQCDAGSSPNCTVFKRNDEGYAYLAENLASWGYSVFSLDQDQMMSRQDGGYGKGMHQRRLLIAALLDALYAANEGAQTETGDYNLPASLVGTLDFTRIGMMGHSRGGDAVSSFIDYNRMRPEGRRYPLRGVISLAPVDYERRAPYGVPYMTILPTCDGDVSNLQGARMFERGQYVKEAAYPLIQSAQVGGNHNWYNTVWEADGEDGGSVVDDACQFSAPNSLRMSGDATEGGLGNSGSYAKGGTDVAPETADKLNPEINTRISGDPARMGDQEKVGLATMSAFFRRYVGGEGAFEPYLTGELAEEGKPQVPLSACPSSPTGTRISCLDRVSTAFHAPVSERLDVLRPDTEMPLGMSALGTKLSASGFANPYLKGGGVNPLPGTTASGLDWCNPDPKQTEPDQLGEAGYPVAAKPCPLPKATALGGQQGVRENGPVNQSYGRQLAVAWNGPASLATKIPAAASDVSEFKALALAAAVNFFDPRNPERSTWDPQVGMQDFTIAVTDGDGTVAKVDAGDPRYGTALQQTHGSVSNRVHVILKEIRVPLADLAEQGLDLTDVRKLELLFGSEGKPASGSIQLADVRFQELVEGTDVLVDSTAPDAGPGEGPPSSGPDPIAELEAYDRSAGELTLPDVTVEPGSNTWTVDDDSVECPTAKFSTIQSAVEYAAPWDTIVVCPGLYEESSKPVHSAANPVQQGALNGLTIDKPLKIKGAGASLVKIKPAVAPGSSLLGTEPFLRDGGGNVVTISRQSLGSTDYNENFTEISGVTIESSSVYVDAGVAFFNTSGRVVDSVVGPLRRTTESTLPQRPHGWGIVATNSLIGAGAGTIERTVTVDRTVVTGYQTGGILFDDATGKDGAKNEAEEALNSIPSGIKLTGYVTDSVVTGSGASTSIPQTGIQFHAGAAGFVENSSIGGNLFTPEQRKSVGVLLTGAETDDWYIEGSLLSGNGYGLFNADVANAAIPEDAPALAVGNFWGTTGTPVVGPSVTISGEEGISGNDTSGDPSVEFSPVLGAAPTLPTVPSPIADEAPIAGIVDPDDGKAVEAGTLVEPVVYAEDDFGIKSVSLTADGAPVASLDESPYVFGWTPGPADVGKTVVLEATITDSSGQAVTSSIEVPVEAAATPEPPVLTPPVTAPPTPPIGKPKPGKLAKNKVKGTAVLTIGVPGPGKVVVFGPGVKKVTRTVKAAAKPKFAIKPKGKKLKALNKKGKVTTVVKVKFTAADGTVTTANRKVTLTKK